MEYLKGQDRTLVPLLPIPKLWQIFSYLDHTLAPAKNKTKQGKTKNNKNVFFTHYIQTATVSLALPPQCVPGLSPSLRLYCHSEVEVTFLCHFHPHHLLPGFLLLLSTPSQQFFLHRQCSTQQIFFFKTNKSLSHPCLKPSNGYPLYSA